MEKDVENKSSLTATPDPKERDENLLMAFFSVEGGIAVSIHPVLHPVITPEIEAKIRDFCDTVGSCMISVVKAELTKSSNKEKTHLN